ncbi:hypothetical protein GCM10010112_94050 [Actinoplanes lobatus]|uniref:Uncharacterized protein n=1 Tax=Actinoplanes lobatus TaxID=113568 RepID=A0A7W7HEN4_9ACTN|nr:hypothetical protein [Actinoplanes lobatus]MBB4749168.1 hypothetical protein [Actinoplanes lobatus]GGN99874.1 hypothetical protein GCM10010112_94050 [Actinoplanes lobatus]GIE46445.1 hypothetical protein Alo02nite_93430 [Actinoplanes lobatus]
MSIYTEYELRCDCGLPGDPYGCDPAIYANTRAKALADAKAEGWTTQRRDGRDYHYRPGHDTRGGG